MLFQVVQRGASYIKKPESVILFQDRWDDFGFRTTFAAKYYDFDCKSVELGSVQIGYIGMDHGRVIDALQEEFECLKDDYFSIGSSEVYYEKLALLDDEIRVGILCALHDIAYDLSLFERYESEEVVTTSFLREKTKHTVLSQFHRMAHGGAKLNKFNFHYETPSNNNKTMCSLVLDFDVIPDSTPPTNVHVLIGRNGIGKTYLLQNMIKSLLTSNEQYGIFVFDKNENDQADDFANILCVAFSPFDDFSSVSQLANPLTTPFQYIGLNKQCSDLLSSVNSQFLDYFRNCNESKAKIRRWETAIETLGNDPAFVESQIFEFPQIWRNDTRTDKKSASERITTTFSRLSSGHKVVLLTITACVDKLEEKTILFLDEPENHLHPPLLASFIRALTYLLIDRNGIAILSTHSPVILQEVPKSCVWNIRRNGSELLAERLQVETFGSSISLLTSEVFGLEVTESGYHKLIKDILESKECQINNYEMIEKKFDKQLGNEAQALIRTMLNEGKE
ncbi:MAG: AAA family ATPase [Christensenella sp.]|nr:AAA family ATPase [Christensenella sp.]